MSVAVLTERNRGRRPMPNAAERRWQTEICLARRTFPKPDRFQNQTRIRLLHRADAEGSVQDADRARCDERNRRKRNGGLGHHQQLGSYGQRKRVRGRKCGRVCISQKQIVEKARRPITKSLRVSYGLLLGKQKIASPAWAQHIS